MTIYKKLDKLLVENLNEVLAMHNRGIKLTFTDITAIRTIMETYLFSNQEGAVALANIFAGRQPYFLPKMASKSVTVPIPFYKRSSFIDIPFGMPYFKLFYF